MEWKDAAIMAIDTTTPTSRRALLAGIAGGLAAAVAGGLGRAQPVAATTPPYVRLGNDNNATQPTVITSTIAGGDAFYGYGTGTGKGVAGYSSAGAGAQGTSVSGYGVRGTSDSGYGVLGQSPSGTGVVGSSTSVTGVYGITASGNFAAVIGRSDGNGTAVEGYSGTGTAPAGPAKTGVYGYAGQGAGSVGLRGRSPTGRGGVFVGKLAQVRLSPSSARSHPASGQLGDLFVDKNKRLWFCKGGTSWKQVA